MLPLEGSLGDWLDITLVQNPWQAIVVCVALFALLIWPSVAARQSAKRVEKTLTTNNGGSSVKDANDRQEKALAEISTKLDGHIEWSEGYVKDTAVRLDELEARSLRWPLRRPKGW